jgi:hypothetical protein
MRLLFAFISENVTIRNKHLPLIWMIYQKGASIIELMMELSDA